jgi:hypothetical protein
MEWYILEETTYYFSLLQEPFFSAEINTSVTDIIDNHGIKQCKGNKRWKSDTEIVG